MTMLLTVLTSASLLDGSAWKWRTPINIQSPAITIMST